MNVTKRILTANILATLAAGFGLAAAVDGALARGGGGGGGGSNHGGNDHAQHSVSNSWHIPDNHNRREVKKSESSPNNSRRTADAPSHSRPTVKPPKNTIHPIINKGPVATTAPAKPAAGADTNHAADKTDRAANSSPAASDVGAATTVVPPLNTIHPIISTTSAPPVGPVPPTNTIHPIPGAPAPETRDHRHEAGALPPGEGDISRGSNPPTTTALKNDAPPAAPNANPALATYSSSRGVDGKTVNPDRNEPIRTNSNPVAAPSPSAPTVSFDGPKEVSFDGPKKGFDVQIVRDQRADHQPQDCGAHPGCDISGSLGSLGSVADSRFLALGKVTRSLIEGTYATVKGWF